MSYSLSVHLDSEPVSCLQDQESNNKMAQFQHSRFGDSDTCDTTAGHNSFHTQRLEPEQSQLAAATVKQKLHSLSNKLSSENQSCTKLETVLLLLKTTECYLTGNLEEKDVTETMSALLEAKDWGCVYSSSLFNCIGRWLGQQFYAANSKISHKVEGFKVHHIERISDLPPAEQLATELFPDAMQTLLLHWMGLSEESALEKRRTEYPILLLILEFANHNLITGVAHVLYSSLICK